MQFIYTDGMSYKYIYMSYTQQVCCCLMLEQIDFAGPPPPFQSGHGQRLRSDSYPVIDQLAVFITVYMLAMWVIYL